MCISSRCVTFSLCGFSHRICLWYWGCPQLGKSLCRWDHLLSLDVSLHCLDEFSHFFDDDLIIIHFYLLICSAIFITYIYSQLISKCLLYHHQWWSSVLLAGLGAGALDWSYPRLLQGSCWTGRSCGTASGRLCSCKVSAGSIVFQKLNWPGLCTTVGPCKISHICCCGWPEILHALFLNFVYMPCSTSHQASFLHH